MINFDKVVGLYHFLSDVAPKNIPLVDPKPHRVNPWRENGLPLVSKVKAGEDITHAINKTITLLGSLGDAISSGDRVIVKPNFNSPDPFPASTDLAFLRAIVEMLLAVGARAS